jgi:ABC-type sugar transport system permease subunit
MDNQKARSSHEDRVFSKQDSFTVTTLLKYLALMLFNAFGLVFVYTLLREDAIGLGVVLGIILLGVNIITLFPKMYPLRWMLPGLALMTLLVIYPVIYTIQNAFTNYGDGHLYSHQQAVRLISDRGYVPTQSRAFNYTIYRASDDDFALWLVDSQTSEIFFARQGEPLEPVTIGELGYQSAPTSGISGFVALEQPGALIGAMGGSVLELPFQEPIGMIAVAMSSPQNVETEARYIIQATQQIIYDKETDSAVPVRIFQRGDEFGFSWTSDDGLSYSAYPNEPIWINNLPRIEGYNLVDASALSDAGLTSLSFDAPLGEITFGTLDPITVDDFGMFKITPQYIFDTVSGLTINQTNGRLFETTYFENDAGDFALWLTESGSARRITRAMMILPNQNIREIDITNRRALETLNIRLAAGATIPDRIGTFNRTSTPETLDESLLSGISAGFVVRPFDFDRSFVFDLEQGYAMDYQTGLIYDTYVYQNAENQFALWMDSDTRERGRIDKILARPDQPLIINDTPATFKGYTLALTDRERAEAIAFLQDIEVDYFGEPDASANERVGIIPQQLGRAGQPYLLRYIYNSTERTFVDLSTVDATTLDLSTLNLDSDIPYNTAGLLSVVQYISDDENGIFTPAHLRFVYNELENAWVDLSSVSLANAGSYIGDDIATRPLPSIPGFANATLFNEYAEAGVFAPRGWIYNDFLDAFIQTDDTSFSTVSLPDLQASNLQYVIKNHDTGLYIPHNWYYNATSDQFINLASNPDADQTGLDLRQLDIEELRLLSADNLIVYNHFSDQAVYAPVGWAYNQSANAFVDLNSIPSRFDLSEIDVTTVDISTEEAFERATILHYDDNTKSYVPKSYIWLDSIDSYIDTSRIDGIQEAENPVETLESLLAQGAITQTIALGIAREPLLYDASPVWNESVNGYIYIPDARLNGVNLDEIHIPTIQDTLLNAPLIRNQQNNARISPLVYADTLVRPVSESERYILGVDIGGQTLTPGYRVFVGLDNFVNLISDQRLYGPLVDIFVWTVTFALASVLITFVAGLFMALILNDDGIPGRRIIRSLLIIPYAIPGVIGIIVWQGMLNQNLGIITNTFVSWFGIRPQWFTDPTLAKFAILLVNLWLGYPYMMLVCSGALQSIPSDVYEAAAVDGARPLQRFFKITLPLLLVTVGPLLIASFTFNFNNYLLIELLTGGNPPIPGTPTPAGYTDLLISYTYNLAFGTGAGAQYGYASAITIVIFALVAIVTMIQFRFTRQWEEVGENA